MAWSFSNLWWKHLSSSSSDSYPTLAVGLTEIFSLQDEALRRNLLNEHGVHEYAGLLSSLAAISFQALHEMRFAEEKQTVVRHLGTDTLSYLVVAARVGLWGALPESLSVLRGAIESCAQFAFVVTEKKYGTVIYEATKLGRFREIHFDEVCSQLGPLGEKLRKLHEKISNAASHSTVKRFSLLEYEFEGQEYDRLGFAVDPKSAKLVIFHCLLLANVLAKCLQLAYAQDKATFRWTPEIEDAERIIDALPAVDSDTARTASAQ
jgi:hypothetical protein